MANSALKGRKFKIPSEILVNIKGTLSSNDETKGRKRAENLLDGKITYEEMKRLKNFFDKYDGENREEFNLNGGGLMKKWVETQLERSRKAIENVKRTRMKGGEENQYLKKHTKDKENANPTNVNVPKIHKGSMYDQLMDNKVRYESIESEIDSMRYLIEYMNNNKNII